MPQDQAVYDLGEVDLGDRKTAAFPALFGRNSVQTARRDRGRGSSRHAGRVSPKLAGSLSLFVPGLGHLAAGEVAFGLFYAASLGFCAAAIWAAYATRASILPTLKVLDVPAEGLVVGVAVLAIIAMLLHLAAIWHAQESAGGEDAVEAAHPIVAGLASLLVPGWGQILVGHPRRATFFVGALWTIAFAWLAATPLGLRALGALGLDIPPALREEWGTAILIASPAVVWVIAIYDAARR